jgi:hypothetical protein
MPPARTLTSWLGPVRRPPTSGEVLRDVDLFASGHYRGKDYTVADLEEMAENFARLGPFGKKLLDPPACLGHEETQAYLERTDLPAAGWVRRVTVVKYHEPATGKEEAVLRGDIVGVPTSIANKIRNRTYRKVSAEVYSDFTDDFGRSYGKALRRVAFLGAEVPQVKRIGDLPLPEPERFAEARPTALRPTAARVSRPGTRDETVLCFSEVTRMGDENQPPGRQERIEAILSAMPNLAMPTLEGMTDDQLADLAKNLPPTQPPEPTMNPMTPPPMPGMGADLTRDEMIAELTAAGQDPTALAGMTDDDLRNLLAQAGAGGMAPMADGEGLTPEEMVAELVNLGEDPDTLAAMTPEELQALYDEMTNPQATQEEVAAMSEFGRRLRAAQARRRAGSRPNAHVAYAEIAHARKVARRTAEFSGGQLAAATRADAEAFCDQLTKEGRLLPAHRPIFLRDLLAADNLNPVAKFTENGRTVHLTAYERRKRELAQLPARVNFGERIPGGGPTDDASAARAEVRTVEKFAEMFGPEIRKQGGDPVTMVKVAKRRAETDPEFRAASLIGQHGVDRVR